MPFIGPKASVVLHGSDDLNEGRYGLVIKIYMVFFQNLKHLPDAGFNSAGVLDLRSDFFCFESRLPALLCKKLFQLVHLRSLLIVVPVRIPQQFFFLRHIPRLRIALTQKILYILEIVLFKLITDDVFLPEAIWSADCYVTDQDWEQLLNRGLLAVLPVEDVHKVILANNAARERYGSKGAIDMKALLDANRALFAGGEMPQEDKDLFFQAVTEAYFECKKQAHDKFTPEKYRK